jgi:large-conductance mechanosensitive channel
LNTVQFIGAVVGFLIIAVTVWQIVKNGVAKSNGRIPERDDSWWGGFPPS